MDTIRLIVSVLAGMVGLLIVCSNVTNVLRARADQQYRSFVPLLGGFAGIIAILVWPAHIARWWLVLPILVDYTWSVLLATALAWAWRKVAG